MCALPASDAFTGTTGTNLTAYSANWTANSGVMRIQNNAACPDAASDTFYRWNADVFPDDQYASGTILTPTSGVYSGAAARISTSGAQTAYMYYGDSGTRYFGKYIAGTYTQFGAVASGLSASDLLRIEANGTTITPKRNGATDSGVGGAVTDSALASGSAGLSGWGNGGTTSTRIDDWGGGSLGGAAVPIGRLRQYMQAVNRAATY